MFMTDVGGATDGFTESFNPFDSATFEFMLTGELVPFTCFSLLALPMLGMGRGSRFSSIMRLVCEFVPFVRAAVFCCKAEELVEICATEGATFCEFPCRKGELSGASFC